MLHECLLLGTCRRDQLRQVDGAWPGLVRSEDVAHFGLPWKESANGLVSDLALESDYGVVDKSVLGSQLSNSTLSIGIGSQICGL